jgi:hypothetical protein
MKPGRYIHILVLLLAVIPRVAVSDYLPPIADESLVMMLELKDCDVSDDAITIHRGEKEYTINYDSFWMQHLIYSDGICISLQDDDPRSVSGRISEIQDAKNERLDGKLLVQLVRDERNPWCGVSYLKLFDAESEYARYFPKKEFYDTIELPFTVRPRSPERFTELLEQTTEVSLSKLEEWDRSRQRLPTCGGR